MAREKKEVFDQIKYQNEFIKAKYDRIEIVVAKGKKEEIKKYAKEHGMSVTEFINKAISERMEKTD